MKNNKAKVLVLVLVMILSCCFKVNAEELINADRVFGENRYETSIKISQQGWYNSDGAILVTGENYPDALSVAPFAKENNIPILLTKKDGVSRELMDELARLKVYYVVVVGGNNVISTKVEQDIKETLGIVSVRISGRNRYETSVKVAKNFLNYEEIFVASGNSFADALSVSTVAASRGGSIILSEKDKLDSSVEEFINTPLISKSYVIGGENAISNEVLNELPNSKRISGANRYETNYKILDCFKDDLNFEKTYLATGTNFPDALSSSALANTTKSPIVLTSNNVDDNTLKILNESKENIKSTVIIGGNNAVSKETVDKLKLKEIKYMSNNLKPYKHSKEYLINNGNILSMANNTYCNGYSFQGWRGSYVFNLDRKYKNISGILGGYLGRGFRVQILCDGVDKGIYKVKNGELPKIIDIDVTGVKDFEFKVLSNSSNYINFANVVLDKKDSIKSINLKKNVKTYKDIICMFGPYYQSHGYDENNFSMLSMGNNYYGAGYSFMAYPGSYCFNLKGQYETVSGVLGSRYAQELKVEIVCDGEVRQVYEMQNGDLPQIIDIDVKGVHKFEFKILGDSENVSDRVNFAYPCLNGRLINDINKNSGILGGAMQLYYSDFGCFADREEFLKMGGVSYKRGTSIPDFGTGSFCYNFAGKYKKFTCVLGSSTNKAFKLEFLCDGVSKGIYDFKDGDLPREVELDVTGANKFEYKVISVEKGGYINLANCRIE